MNFQSLNYAFAVSVHVCHITCFSIICYNVTWTIMIKSFFTKKLQWSWLIYWLRCTLYNVFCVEISRNENKFDPFAQNKFEFLKSWLWFETHSLCMNVCLSSDIFERCTEKKNKSHELQISHIMQYISSVKECFGLSFNAQLFDFLLFFLTLWLILFSNIKNKKLF